MSARRVKSKRRVPLPPSVSDSGLLLNNYRGYIRCLNRAATWRPFCPAPTGKSISLSHFAKWCYEEGGALADDRVRVRFDGSNHIGVVLGTVPSRHTSDVVPKRKRAELFVSSQVGKLGQQRKGAVHMVGIQSQTSVATTVAMRTLEGECELDT